MNNEFNSKNSKPMSVISLLLYQILFIIPLLGFVPIVITLVRKNANKNLKNLAITYIVWQLVVVGGLAFFLFSHGVGYILEWIDKELGLIAHY